MKLTKKCRNNSKTSKFKMKIKIKRNLLTSYGTQSIITRKKILQRSKINRCLTISLCLVKREMFRSKLVLSTWKSSLRIFQSQKLTLWLSIKQNKWMRRVNQMKIVRVIRMMKMSKKQGKVILL